MDSDTMHVASRLTAAMLPKVALEAHGETAAAQVAALYWAVLHQIVEQRKQKDRPTALPGLKE